MSVAGKGLLVRSAVACWLTAAAAAAPALRAAADGPGPMRMSRPYTVTFTFELTSPLIPDGRASLAELAFRVVFAPVVFGFDPDGDPLLGRCQLETGRGKGDFLRFVLNDIQRGADRQAASFLTPRPVDFAAGLDIESEPTEDDEAAAASRVPPARVRLGFWTDFGAGEVKWGAALGTGVLGNLRTVFEAPFGDLMAGRARTIAHPYEGKYPEDRGIWKIEFTPGIKRNTGGAKRPIKIAAP